MKKLWLCFFLFSYALSSCQQNSDQSPLDLTLNAPKKVLFLGNSHTFFNGGIDKSLQGFVDQGNIPGPIIIDKIVAGGYTFKQHWLDTETIEKINSRKWNLIVLQENGNVAANDYPKMEEFGIKLNDYIANKGIKVFLFMTWAYHNTPGMTENLIANYTELVNKTSAGLVPAGLAFKAFQDLNNGINLYDDDGVHPSPEGTFLTAAYFYRSLYGKDPSQNDFRGGLTIETSNIIKKFVANYNPNP